MVDRALEGNGSGAPRIAAALAFLEKLARAPDEVNSADIEQLYRAGIGPGGADDLVVICFGFSLINRLAEAFGFEIPAAVLPREASFAWHFGYRLASGAWFRWPRRTSREAGIARLLAAALEGPGALRAPTRCAAFRDSEFPEPMQSYLAAVRRCCSPPDGQEGLLLRAGYSEDQIFEAAVCAAEGAAVRRLDAGLRALGARWPIRLPCNLDDGASLRAI